MHCVSRPSLFLAALCTACSTAPEPAPSGVALASAGSWSVAGPAGVRLVSDRVALDACLAPGGAFARAAEATTPAIDFGRHWCLLATDARHPADEAMAYLAVGDEGAARLAIVGRDPEATRVRSARAWLVPRGKVTALAVGAEALELPAPASKAPLLPVLDVRGPVPAPATLHASWRVTEAAELRTMVAAFGKAAPQLPGDWLDPATECVVVARLPAGTGPLQRLAVAEEEGVDVLTLSTAGDAPDADVNVAHWVKLPRRERTLTLVHRAEAPTGPVETVLGTWPPLR